MQKGELWQNKQTGRRSFQPSTHQRVGCSDVWLAVKADRQIAANDMCWEHLIDGLMTGGEKQADGARQGDALAVPSQWSGLRLREHLGMKGISNG